MGDQLPAGKLLGAAWGQPAANHDTDGRPTDLHDSLLGSSVSAAWSLGSHRPLRCAVCQCSELVGRRTLFDKHRSDEQTLAGPQPDSSPTDSPPGCHPVACPVIDGPIIEACTDRAPGPCAR